MSVVLLNLAQTVRILQEVFYVVLMVRIVASFFPPRTAGLWSRATEMSVRLTEPILGPIRRRIPLMGMLDLSPLVAFFLVDIASYILQSLFIYLARL